MISIVSGLSRLIAKELAQGKWWAITFIIVGSIAVSMLCFVPFFLKGVVFKSGDSFILPHSYLVSVDNKDNGTVIRYETYKGGIRNFYEKKLQKLGWIKISDLGREDMTYSGGDWGGIYKKEQTKFKLHICGPDRNNFLTSIFFSFYNIPPEQVLGKDFHRPKVKKQFK